MDITRCVRLSSSLVPESHSLRREDAIYGHKCRPKIRVQRKCSVALWCLCRYTLGYTLQVLGAINNIGRDFKCLRWIRRNQQTKEMNIEQYSSEFMPNACSATIECQLKTTHFQCRRLNKEKKICPGNPSAISENDCSRIQDAFEGTIFAGEGVSSAWFESDAKLYLSFSVNSILTKLLFHFVFHLLHSNSELDGRQARTVHKLVYIKYRSIEHCKVHVEGGKNLMNFLLLAKPHQSSGLIDTNMSTNRSFSQTQSKFVLLFVCRVSYFRIEVTLTRWKNLRQSKAK